MAREIRKLWLRASHPAWETDVSLPKSFARETCLAKFRSYLAETRDQGASFGS